MRTFFACRSDYKVVHLDVRRCHQHASTYGNRSSIPAVQEKYSLGPVRFQYSLFLAPRPPQKDDISFPVTWRKGFHLLSNEIQRSPLQKLIPTYSNCHRVWRKLPAPPSARSFARTAAAQGRGRTRGARGTRGTRGARRTRRAARTQGAGTDLQLDKPLKFEMRRSKVRIPQKVSQLPSVPWSKVDSCAQNWGS